MGSFYQNKYCASATITGMVIMQTIVVKVIIPAGTSVSLPNFCASIPESAAEGAEQAIMQDVATPLSVFRSMQTKSAIAGEAISLKKAPI